jgi:hypothetical protein
VPSGERAMARMVSLWPRRAVSRSDVRGSHRRMACLGSERDDRERQRETERHRETQRDTERERQRDRERHRERERPQ